MTKLYFKCTFKSDIVLHASSNTEGKIDRLDFIPGSNFLGMVAQNYDKFKTDAKAVFHDGAVRFGDATILIENKPSYQVPYSWFAPKGYSLEEASNKKDLFNEYHLTDRERDEYLEKDKQLKQQRVGYFNQDGIFRNIEHIYRQKSAYDRKKRRSKKSQMFGYYALPKGTEWLFSVEFDDEKYINDVTKYLISAQYLGKSRSAEYGHIEITQLKDTPIEQPQQELKTIEFKDKDDKTKHYIFLYAKSRLALTDKYGNNSYTPSLESLALEGEGIKIDYEKSYIRTSRYTPYVGARANFDFERLIINQGSVIAIEVPSSFNVAEYVKKVERGVGLYLSEGHGKVIVNPDFVTKKEPFNNMQQSQSAKVTYSNGDISKWLKEQQQKEQEDYELLKRVIAFIDNPKHNVKNKKSQWGQIRSLCNSAKDDEAIYNKLFSEAIKNNHKEGFLLHGKAQEKWDNNLIEAIKEQKDKGNYLKFIKLLSIYAPKEG